MEMSTLALVRRQIEFLPATSILRLPPNIYGLYVLFEYTPGSNCYNVRYVGVASSRKTGDARSMLEKQHRANGSRWSHCSVYELWEDIDYGDELEIERLFERIYSRDAKLKMQKSRSKKNILDENSFVAKQLFISFVKRMAKL